MAFFLGHKSYVSLTFKGQDYIFLYLFFQEDQNRGKPNWEHLNDELHVLITVEDSENRAQMKLQRAVDEVKKLLIVVSTILSNHDILTVMAFSFVVNVGQKINCIDTVCLLVFLT